MTWALAAAVVALQVPYPLVHGHARDALTVATVLVFAAASLLHAARTEGARATAALAMVAVGGGFAAEVVGVHTGIPFGHYRYTGGLGPTLLDVPVVIPLAWAMMTWPALLVAERVTSSRLLRVATAAVALASWDVFLDPQMVDARHWRWTPPFTSLPGIEDVPVTNFGGWLLVSVLLMAVLTAIAPLRARAAEDRPMVALWIWTWLSSTLANLAFFSRPAVAGWGFAAMALVGVPLLRKTFAR